MQDWTSCVDWTAEDPAVVSCNIRLKGSNQRIGGWKVEMLVCSEQQYRVFAITPH
jgi:hypothetical protein